MAYWLMKTEPNVFSFEDLKKLPEQTTGWEGVRNYQARNFLRDQIKKGDLVLFYHSSCDNVGVMGVAEVVKDGHPDESAWNKKSPYYDPKSTFEKPQWFRVDVKWKRDFKKLISLEEIKNHPKLCKMKVAQKGMRLSVQPVTEEEFHLVCELGQT